MARDMPKNRINNRYSIRAELHQELDDAATRAANEEYMLRKAAARSMIRGAAKMEDAATHANRIIAREELRRIYNDIAGEGIREGLWPMRPQNTPNAPEMIDAKNFVKAWKKFGKVLYKVGGEPAVAPPLSAADVWETMDAMEFGTKNAIRAASNYFSAVEKKYKGRKTMKEPK